MVFKALQGIGGFITEKITTPAANIITAGIEKLTGKKYGRSTAQELRKQPGFKALETAIGGAAVVATGALGAKTVLTKPTLSKSVLTGVAKAAPKTVKGKLALGVGGPIVGSALAGSPTLRTAAKKTLDPRENIKRGQDIATFIETKPKETKEKIASVLSKGAILGVGAGALAAGAAIVPKFIKGGTKGKTSKPQTPAASGVIGSQPSTTGAVGGAVPIAKPTPIGTIKERTAKPRRRKAKKQPIRVSQRVNVNVSQRQSRKYLNSVNVYK